MRFKLEKPLTEKDFDKTRCISKFLWLPREINYEIRWLESVLIEQKVTFNLHYDEDCGWATPNPPTKVYYWQDSKWIDPQLI